MNNFTKKANACTLLLSSINGEDVNREGLIETPARFAKAFEEYTKGYSINPESVMKTFEDGAEEGTLVVVEDMPFYSLCEHHLAPFFGTVTVEYVVSNRVLGLSKFKRLVDIYAKRLQVQERFTKQICTTVFECLKPIKCEVIVKGRHMCMEARGVQSTGQQTITKCIMYS